MKKIIFSLMTFILPAAQSIAADLPSLQLRCAKSKRVGFFATLAVADHPNPIIDKASLRFGFASADNLKCSDHNSLDEPISCIGHWYGSPQSIVEAEIKKLESGELRVTVHNWKAGINDIAEGFEFNCIIE